MLAVHSAVAEADQNSAVARLCGSSARLGSPTEIPYLVVVDRVGPALERWRRFGAESRRVVIPEGRDELEEWTLRSRECWWSRGPHSRAAARRVALELRIVAVIANTRREHGDRRGLTNDDATRDRGRARGEAGNRRVVGALNGRRLRRELVEGHDVRRTDCRSFG